MSGGALTQKIRSCNQLIPEPAGYEFTGEFKAPEYKDYWISFGALFQGHIIAAGPRRKSHQWPPEERRIILRKVST